MLPTTISKYTTTVDSVGFSVLIGSAYRNPMYNDIKSVEKESPHMYGKGIDLNPVGRNRDCKDPVARKLYAQRMQLLFIAAPNPKLLEAGTGVLDAEKTYNGNPLEDDVPDVFDVCRSGADHVHIGSGRDY